MPAPMSVDIPSTLFVIRMRLAGDDGLLRPGEGVQCLGREVGAGPVADIAGMDVLGVDVLRASFQRSGAGRSASTDLSAGNFPNGFSFPGLFCRRGTMVAKSKSRWSGEVTQHSDALDLEKDIFESNNPDAIAKSLKHSAETSDRRKSSPYRSAMSMLTFYINRAGKNLSKPR
ncbi:MAG TPA: DUF3175 domain-containing protein, partial [Rhodopila sp.]|nr:DUF3175 domain-containing protein [Rhodopila sp.]